jgi:hypothetical protein
MSIFVLDTNILYCDPRLESDVWQARFERLQSHGWQVVLPEIVLMEVEAKLRDRIEKARGAAADFARATRQTLNTSFDSHAFSRAEIEELRKTGQPMVPLTTADLPMFPHRLAVERMLADRRPCRRSAGKDGYRDLLVWWTCLELAISSEEKVYLVTDNIADFADQTNSTLHRDMVADLLEHGISSDRVQLVRGANEIDKIIDDYSDKYSKILEVVLASQDSDTYSELECGFIEALSGSRTWYRFESRFDVTPFELNAVSRVLSIRTRPSDVRSVDGCTFVLRVVVQAVVDDSDFAERFAIAEYRASILEPNKWDYIGCHFYLGNAEEYKWCWSFC